MSYKISLLIWPLALIILGLILGCGDNTNLVTPQSGSAVAEVSSQPSRPSGTISTEPKITVLRVPLTDSPNSTVNFLVAQETGIAKKYNIDFEFVGVIPAPQVVASVVGNRIDTTGTHVNRTIAGISAGAKIKAVVASSETTKRVPHMLGIVTKQSNVRTAADLVGKNIGITTIGGCHEYTPYAFLSKHGINDPKNNVKIHVIPLNSLEQALRQGDIDIAMIHKLPEEVISKGEFDIVFSDYDVWRTLGGGTPYFFTYDFIRDRPEVVRNFVMVMSETNNWSNNNPEAGREITARRTKTDINKIKEGYFAKNGIIIQDTIQVWIDLLVKYDEIKPGITPDQIYTNEFNSFYSKNI